MESFISILFLVVIFLYLVVYKYEEVWNFDIIKFLFVYGVNIFFKVVVLLFVYKILIIFCD